MQPHPTEDIEIFFHSILFAYQKAIRQTLGTGAAVFIQPLLQNIQKISHHFGIPLVVEGNLEETLKNYTDILKRSGLVQNAWYTKLSPNQLLFGISGCIYAKKIHPILKPENATCRYALVAMAICQAATSKQVKYAESKFTEDGSETVIEILP